MCILNWGGLVCVLLSAFLIDLDNFINHLMDPISAPETVNV